MRSWNDGLRRFRSFDWGRAKAGRHRATARRAHGGGNSGRYCDLMPRNGSQGLHDSWAPSITQFAEPLFTENISTLFRGHSHFAVTPLYFQPYLPPAIFPIDM